MAFVHLHSHTEYSLLDGLNRIKDYVKKVKELGMNACAITDHGVMYGTIQFYETCKKEGIKPIIGCEVYVAPGSMYDKTSSRKKEDTGDDKDERYNHLILLAENNVGLANLYKICSIGFTDGYYYKPRIDKTVLEKYHEGIICCSACLAGEIPRYILSGQYEKAKETALWFKNTFGENNYFLEMQNHFMREDTIVNTDLIRISKDLNIPLVATNDVHYTNAEDAKVHDILICMQTQKTITDETRMIYNDGQFYVKSEAEMRELFPYCQEAIDNTQMIANRCNVEIEFGVTKMPYVEVPKGYTPWTYLNKLCYDGLKERYPNDDGTVKKQLDYELGVIQKMGFVEYFLIVWDYINYARSHGIPVGPGRGSAAGSVVSYTLRITNIDPIKYQLKFERFLNPERVSMPDIDIDFADRTRQKVIDYVAEKYGDDKVTQIVTFGTLAARNVVRSVGKVLEIPYARCDKLAKMIPKQVKITIKDALNMNPDLRKEYESDAETKNLIDACIKLEGLPKNASTHASGVVIYKEAAMNYVPLALGKDGAKTTQFNMVELEHLGLLKMDFLGLKTRTVISDAVEMIEKTTGKVINIDEIDFDDKKTLEMISNGDTDGVFQLESAGMRGFMKELKPTSLDDIIAGISLYRPGPMDFIPKYLAGKNDPTSITYPCEQMRPILQSTYGCIVYQEQVMDIVRALAGYNMGKADNIRRAMSKKKQEVIEAERQNFIYGDPKNDIPGCIKMGIPEDVANSVYDSMLDFAKYAFNKSHAACYAVVAMQTAWLKCYYPTQFMAALMNSVINKPDKLKPYIHSMKSQSMKLLMPSVNKSYGNFTYEDGNIRFGLVGIKDVGESMIEALVEERESGGEFTSFEDFLERTITFINNRAMEALIWAGALDEFAYNRRTLMNNHAVVREKLKKDKSKGIDGQMSLFEMFDDLSVSDNKYNIIITDEFNKEELLEKEKEFAGLYISGHPLEDYEVYIKNKHITATLDKFMLKLPESENGEEVSIEDAEMEYKGDPNIFVAGMITKSKVVYTKKDNRQMLFATIEDMVGEIEIVVFPKQYEEKKDILFDGNFIFVKGRLQLNEKGVSLTTDDIHSFEEQPPKVWVRLPSQAAGTIENVESICEDGNATLMVYYEDTKSVLKSTKNIAYKGNTITKLCSVYGRQNVKLT